MLHTPLERRQGGQIAGSETAKALGRLGGLAKARRDPVAAAKSFGVGRLIEKFAKDAHVEPFVEAGER